MYYLCGESNSDGLVETVILRAISETQPENHLKTLIERNLLDEAEKFAIEFKLSLAPVHEARAKFFIESLGTGTITTCTDEWKKQFDDFLKIAKLIKNEEFLLTLRDLDINDRHVMKQLLEFLLGHIKSEVGQKES